MPERVKWGVLGSGGIARRRTIPEGIAAARNARLAAVFDVDAEVNRAVAAQFGATAALSVADLLKRNVDAVYIATPAHVHYEQVLAAARAGKHVFCEKPLGMSVAEAETMVEVARRAGVLFGCAFMMRFHSRHLAAKALIEEGRVGKLVYGRAQLSCWYPPMPGAWRQDPATGGGGSLIDMGGHCIDLLEVFFGPARRVSCFTRNTVHAYPSEDSAVVLLEFESGALGTVDAFFCISDEGSRNRLELHGTAGSILADGTLGQDAAGTMTAMLRTGAGGYEAQQARDAGGGFDISPEPVNMYRAEIEAFGQAVLEGREPSVGAGAGVRSQKVLTACYESARTGHAVDV
jgi:predicted dehydrogenase